MKSLKFIFSLFLLFGFVSVNAQDDLYYTPDYTESYTDGSGDTYVTNNYYSDSGEDYVFYDDNDYDYFYSSRIRRFSRNRSYRGFGYFHDVYTNRYFYDYDPFFYGYSIYDRPSYSWGVRNFSPGWSNVYFVGNGFSIFPYWSQRRNFNRWNRWNNWNRNSWYTPAWAYSGFYNNPYYYGPSYNNNSYYSNYYDPCAPGWGNSYYSASNNFDGSNGLVNDTYYGPRGSRADLGGFSSTAIRPARTTAVEGQNGKWEPAATSPANSGKPGTTSSVITKPNKPGSANKPGSVSSTITKPNKGSVGSASKPGTVYQKPASNKPSGITTKPSNSSKGNTYDFYGNDKPNTKPARTNQVTKPKPTNRPPVSKPTPPNRPSSSDKYERDSKDDYERVQRANRTRMQEDRKAREQRLLEQMREWQRDNDRQQERQERATQQRERQRQAQQQQQRRDRQRQQQQQSKPSRSFNNNHNNSGSMSDRARSGSSRSSSSRSSGSSRSSSKSGGSRNPR